MKHCIFTLIIVLFFTPFAKGQRLLISEVMFDPLPDGADYVELYNVSSTPLPLANYRLVQWKNDTLGRVYPLSDNYVVEPHEYVVITTNAAYLNSHYQVKYPNKVVEVNAMPAYNNKSGTVIVTTANGLMVDRLDYTDKMHNPLLKDVEGVALERRSFDYSTQGNNNWYSAASAVGFGTPTYLNSQSMEFLFCDSDFAIQPDLFSPDGDGYDDHLSITYQLSDGSLSANITVFDAAGRMMKRIANCATLGSNGTLTWDGKRDDGTPCPTGNYLIIIDTYNIQGRHQKLKRTITLIY